VRERERVCVCVGDVSERVCVCVCVCGGDVSERECVCVCGGVRARYVSRNFQTK